MLRIRAVEGMEGLRLRLTLTDGSIVVRDVEHLLEGPIFEPILVDAERLGEARVEAGTVVWPWGADLDPDVLIWGGPAPEQETEPPREMVLERPGAAT